MPRGCDAPSWLACKSPISTADAWSSTSGAGKVARTEMSCSVHAAGSLARVLAWAEAQTRRLVIPGRERAHQPSSHHSQNRLLRLLSGCAAGWPPESGSSAHATSLSTLPDYVL